MQNYSATDPHQPAEKMGSISLLRLLLARHPYASALFFLVYWFAMGAALGRLISPLYAAIHLPLLVYETLAEVTLALVVALPLILLQWWREAGFTRGIDGQGLMICLLPILLIAGPAILSLQLISGASTLIVASAIALTLLVGFAEEGMFRGILITVLLPRGIWPAVLLSAICFALTHLTNLLSGFGPGYVLGQIILAFGTGVLFAALRLRTGSIWPAILLHAIRDVVGLIYLGLNPSMVTTTPSTSAIVFNIVFCCIFLLIAAILLRPGQLEQLQLTYGLASQSAPASPLPYQPYASIPPSHPTYPSASQPLHLPNTSAEAYHDYTSPAAYDENTPEVSTHPTGNETE